MNAKKILMKAARGKKQKAMIERLSEEQAREMWMDTMRGFQKNVLGLTDQEIEERENKYYTRLAEIDAIAAQRDRDVVPAWESTQQQIKTE